MLWIIIVIGCIGFNRAYDVPEARIEVFYPKGFKVSIPDEEGIKLFAFHGKINEELNGREGGTFSRDIVKAKDGRWTFYEPYQKFNVGDILYYWTYVDYFDGRNKLGYTNDDKMFVVKELITVGSFATSTTTKTTEQDGDAATTKTAVTSTDTAEEVTETVDEITETECRSTETTVKGGKITCKGKLIFSEAFTTELREKFWTVEQKFADAPDYEFVMYTDQPECLNIKESKLHLKPVCTDDIFGPEFLTQPFDFKDNCTGALGTQECKRRPDAGFILPPVLSSQITTRKKWSFKYGKVEIRAKLPKGDWIYPELYLNPVNEEYGSGYDSGQIRIAFAPGNDNLNKVLSGGVVIGSSPAARLYGLRHVERLNGWSNDFHRYSVNWTPERISLSVDDTLYGVIVPPYGGFASVGQELNIVNANRWRNGSKMAPFDREMYITIGVGVGGFNFEDRPDGTKPWKNGARLSVKNFYKVKELWKNTWNNDSVMEIDSIKVWAL